MNKKTKVIKFKKLNQNNNHMNNYVGFYEQNTENKKQYIFNNKLLNQPQAIKPKIPIRPQITQNDIQKNDTPIKKEFNNPQEKEYKGEKHQKIKKEDINKKAQTDLCYSDHEDFSLSSIKKKVQPVKIDLPRGYNISESIEQLQDQIVDLLNRSEPIIRIQEIFSLPLMRSILGACTQQQKSVNCMTFQENQQQADCHPINKRNEGQNVQQYDYHEEIFDAFQMQDEDSEDQDQNLNQGLQGNFWNVPEENQNMRLNLQRNYQLRNNQRTNRPIYQGTQFILPSQTTFFEQMNFPNYEMDFQM